MFSHLLLCYSEHLLLSVVETSVAETIATLAQHDSYLLFDILEKFFYATE